ncbi:hypothetical protein [Acinetobacter sp. YH12070]|uniref:hypothetical protein n=1 Tax=Acinetobacter sp. YH12070 TaxID=2601066 RepID=UPI0015D139AF|nr:hypothetical protein [Acinetobacter sp. YH12070]
MKKINLFHGEPIYHQYNACVGYNGWNGMHNYVEGYAEATKAMIENVIHGVDVNKGRMQLSVDFAIYPILFSARHYLELFIKQQIYIINLFKNKESLIEDRLLKTHDIHKLWCVFLKEVKLTYDRRLYKYLNRFHCYIVDFNNMDSTGETFRYPYSQESKMHLTDRSVIGVYSFYEKFNELTGLCEDFSYLTTYLYHEYSVNTYTKKLNRVDIEYISKRVPSRSEWGSEEFKRVRQETIDKLSISCREFNEALLIIQSHLEFNININPNAYYLPIDKDVLLRYLNGKYSMDEIKTLSNKTLAALKALIEISNNPLDAVYFSEYYVPLFEKYYTEYNLDRNLIIFDTHYIFKSVQKAKKGVKRINYNNFFNI